MQNYSLSTLEIVLISMALGVSATLLAMASYVYISRSAAGGFLAERYRILEFYGIHKDGGIKNFRKKVFVQFLREMNSSSVWSIFAFGFSCLIFSNLNFEPIIVLGISATVAAIVAFGFTVASKGL